MEDPLTHHACMWTHARGTQAQLKPTLCSEFGIRNGGFTDCVIVTMSLVADLSRGNSQNWRNFPPSSPGRGVGLAPLDSKRFTTRTRLCACFGPRVLLVKLQGVCGNARPACLVCASQSSLSLEHPFDANVVYDANAGGKRCLMRSQLHHGSCAGWGWFGAYSSGGGVQTVVTMSPPLPWQRREAWSD